MPRPPRLHVEGGYYHVILRGNHREAIVLNTEAWHRSPETPARPDQQDGSGLGDTSDLVAKGEQDLTTAIHAIGAKRGWNKNNTSCELSAFRKAYRLAARKDKNAA